MSILSQLFAGKITFNQGVSEGEQWFSTILSKAPASVQSDVAVGLSSFKQAASNAVALADTAIGPIRATGVTIVESAANTALTAAIGPAAGLITPAIDAGIIAVTSALKAEIDAVEAQFRATYLNGSAAPVVVLPVQAPVVTG